MNKSLLAALNTSERLLVTETEPAALAVLEEDAVAELHDRVRRARNKYVGQYRRGASAAVAAQGGRGKARPRNAAAALKAEAFEQALSRVSVRLGVLARRSAAELRSDRLAAARAARAGAAVVTAPAAVPGKGRPVLDTPAGDRALRSAARERGRAETRAQGARRQAKRDSR